MSWYPHPISTPPIPTKAVSVDIGTLYLHTNTTTNITVIWLYSEKAEWTDITSDYKAGNKIRHPDPFIGRQLKKRNAEGLEPSWVVDRKFQEQAKNLKLLAAAEEAKAQAARGLSGSWGGSSAGSAMAEGSTLAGAAP